ncbi:ABC transporter ATP-binding protein, partial [Marinobacter sp.]
MTALATRELIIDIPGRRSGRPLSLGLEPGQVWGVLGPNGVGKSTLMHTLAGLRPARSGEVRVGGQALAGVKRKTLAQKLGLVFQDPLDGFPATVLETALIGRHPWLRPWQMESRADRELAEQALTALDVIHLRDRLVHTLSG